MSHLGTFRNFPYNQDNYGLELNKFLLDKNIEGVLLDFIKEQLLYKCRKMLNQSMTDINPDMVNSHNLANYNGILDIHNREVPGKLSRRVLICRCRRRSHQSTFRNSPYNLDNYGLELNKFL
jgi:hypothetical protein